MFRSIQIRRLPELMIREVGKFDGRIDELWKNVRIKIKNAQERNSKYMNWQFPAEKGWIKIICEDDKRVVGYAIVYIKQFKKVERLSNMKVLSIIDILWDFNNILNKLVAHIKNLARKNYAECMIVSIKNKLAAGRLIQNGYFRIPGTVYFACHSSDENVELSSRFEDWYITRGDADAAGALGVTIQRKNQKSSKKRLDRVFIRKRKIKHCLNTLHISGTRALDSTA